MQHIASLHLLRRFTTFVNIIAASANLIPLKKYLAIFFIVLVYSIGLYAQADKQILLKIDNIKNSIEHNKASCLKTEKTDSGGCKYIYTKNHVLQMVMVDYKEQNIDKKVEWYFANRQLVYAEQTWTNMVSKKPVDTEKVYLNNGHIIAWLDGQNKELEADAEKINAYDVLLAAYADHLVKEYSK